MTFTDAAAEVLRLVGRPLHYKEITDIAIEKNLLSHVGKSPEVTMGARLAATLKKDTAENPLVRVKPGVFALREWDDKTIKAGMEPKKGARKGQRPEPSAPKPPRADAPEAAEAEDDEVLIGGDDADEVAVDEEPAEDLVEVVEEPIAALRAQPETPKSPAHASHAAHGQLSMLRGLDGAAVNGASAGAVSPIDSAPVPDTSRSEKPAIADGGSPSAPRSTPQSPRLLVDGEEVEAEEAEPPGPDDVMRAEAAAGAAEMFDEEEDDDQPILGGSDDRGAPAPGESGDGRGRRRRRRRRGRANGEASAAPGALPSYVATPAFDGQGARPRNDEQGARPRNDEQGGRPRNDEQGARPRNDEQGARPRNDERRNDDRREGSPRQQEGGDAPYRPQVIELTAGDGHALDDLAGRELADAVVVILSTFDRNAGAVSLRQIAETAQRRGRLAGDAQLVQSQVAASVRADNARRVAGGQRPRFRLAGGRVALTDWLLSGDLARLEQEALAAVDRYRDAARRSFARKLVELPGHAFVEICVLALERIGVSQLRALRRAGVPGGESHFSGILRASQSAHPLARAGAPSDASPDELRLAIVIRRDGREVGRERVADLRGSLHHYGPASAGWVFTAGQTLSGAREEAAVSGVAPIALFDGLAVARLCEENDVAVIRARLPIAIPDVDLLEALRAS